MLRQAWESRTCWGLATFPVPMAHTGLFGNQVKCCEAMLRQAWESRTCWGVATFPVPMAHTGS